MTPIPFWKMSGSGNDFILIDNREGVVRVADTSLFAARICRRKISAGADGLILVENSAAADFKWRFYNSDGSIAEMCGNGARCAARFSFLNGIAGRRMRFETKAGVIGARVNGDKVKIAMTAPYDLVLKAALKIDTQTIKFDGINTGVPHVVIQTDDIEMAPVVPLGRRIRHHARFAPAGTNVNFIAPLEEHVWAIRTYERGVEDETLACGTGNVAAALVLGLQNSVNSPVTLKTRGGEYLKVYFSKQGPRFENIHLEGDARVIYQASLHPDAWG